MAIWNYLHTKYALFIYMFINYSIKVVSRSVFSREHCHVILAENVGAETDEAQICVNMECAAHPYIKFILQ